MYIYICICMHIYIYKYLYIHYVWISILGWMTILEIEKSCFSPVFLGNIWSIVLYFLGVELMF